MAVASPKMLIAELRQEAVIPLTRLSSQAVGNPKRSCVRENPRRLK